MIFIILTLHLCNWVEGGLSDKQSGNVGQVEQCQRRPRKGFEVYGKSLWNLVCLRC